jgi:hypothetical protein
MFKKILAALSLAALMVVNFISTPVAAEASTSTLYQSATYTIFDSQTSRNSDGDLICPNGGIYAVPGSNFPGHVLRQPQKDGWGEIFYGEQWGVPTIYSSTFDHMVVHVSLTDNEQGGGALYVNFDNRGLLPLDPSGYVCYGNSFALVLSIDETNGSQPYHVVIAADLYFTTPVFIFPHYVDGSTLGIDGNGCIFDGVIYFDSWGTIEYPLDMLVAFEMTLPGYITSFNVYTPGLFIEIQGLYQYMDDYDYLSFYDWIGESPKAPRGEEEESYYWYIDLSGAEGWYDIQIWVDFVPYI